MATEGFVIGSEMSGGLKIFMSTIVFLGTDIG